MRKPKKAWKTIGRNKAVAIISCIQHVLIRQPRAADETPPWTSCQIHSPATVLPATNWGTMFHRKRKWSLCSGGRVGRHLLRRVGDGDAGDAAAGAAGDPEAGLDDALQRAVSGTPAIYQIATNDAAGVNDCITRAEQQEFIDDRQDRCYRAHLDLYCQAHQGCLVTRPVYGRCGDLSSIIVRVGHILEGGKHGVAAQGGGRLDRRDLRVQACGPFATGSGSVAIRRLLGVAHVYERRRLIPRGSRCYSGPRQRELEERCVHPLLLRT